MSYVIDQHIPMSEIQKMGRPMSEERAAMLEMEVGHSFLITEVSRVHHVRCIATRMGDRRYTVRKVGGEGWRVWRTQ